MNEQQAVWVVSNINEEKLHPSTVDKASSINDLPAEPPFALVLSKAEHQNWVSLLTHIRSQAGYRFTPIFYHGDIESKYSHLFDGPADEHLNKTAQKIHTKIKSLSVEMKNACDHETQLLAYLYTRPEASLCGYINPHLEHLFEYPLLTILFNDQTIDGWELLQDLNKRDLLTQNDLIDEVQTCSACKSGLLNFKNSCPTCHSIDIKPQKFVHCFSCGEIGPVPEFLRQERLICSRCHVKLHELGVDYEQPKEDKLCNHCGHFFADCNVEVICLVCRKGCAPQELYARRLYGYQLTKRGEYLVRGVEKSIYQNFNHYFKVIDYATFMSIISWQTELANRYSAIHFSVMTLYVSSEGELLEQHGEENASRIMGQLFTSLRQVFRDSDLSSRLDGTMFFLLPLANQDACLVILERIRNAMAQFTEDEHAKELTLGASYITSDEINAGGKGNLGITDLHDLIVESNASLVKAK